MSDASGEGLRKAFERAAAQREADLARPAAEGVQVLTFTVSGEWFALPLTELVEIVGGVEPTPVPFASPLLLGVINHRGAIVPVMDLRRALNLPVQYRRGGASRTVLLRHGGTTLGFQADAIASVLPLAQGAMEPNLPTMEPARARFLQGCARLGDRLVGVLWAPVLVEALRAQQQA